jgi:hypothetical protein
MPPACGHLAARPLDSLGKFVKTYTCVERGRAAGPPGGPAEEISGSWMKIRAARNPLANETLLKDGGVPYRLLSGAFLHPWVPLRRKAARDRSRAQKAE